MQAWIITLTGGENGGDQRLLQDLGLTLETSAQDIKKAYRKLAMQYHHHRNRGNPENEERSKEIMDIAL